MSVSFSLFKALNYPSLYDRQLLSHQFHSTRKPTLLTSGWDEREEEGGCQPADDSRGLHWLSHLSPKQSKKEIHWEAWQRGTYLRDFETCPSEVLESAFSVNRMAWICPWLTTRRSLFRNLSCSHSFYE